MATKQRKITRNLLVILILVETAKTATDRETLIFGSNQDIMTTVESAKNLKKEVKVAYLKTILALVPSVAQCSKPCLSNKETKSAKEQKFAS